MKELIMFENFLNRKQINTLKQELILNEAKLSKALHELNFSDVHDLKVQRENLKTMLIESLELELKRVG